MTHAINIQEQMIDLLNDIDETSPLPLKQGRILVALNVLANEITTDLEAESYNASAKDVRKWLKHTIETLPSCVAHFHGGDFEPRRSRKPRKQRVRAKKGKA